MFASYFCDRFARGVWSDPGVVFDESRPNVNYWESWYLGRETDRTRTRGIISAESPRTGAYNRLVEAGYELHALMAPRPFLVAMTNRPGHNPTEESNEQVYRFLEHVLKPGKGAVGR